MDRNSGRSRNQLIGQDTLGAMREIQAVTRSDGVKALAVDSRTVVESTFGFDQQPDTYFKIIKTGGAGTIWTISIAATANDPTSPDRDMASYQKIFTVQAGEVGDEVAFRDRIIQELNADTNFKPGILMKAQKATDRAIVHIYSEAFSASGEFYERPNAGDFDVQIGGTPGDGQVVIGYDNIISRSKPITISRDIDSPHRLGLFGITGQVFVTAKELSDLYVSEAVNPTYGNDLLQAGSLGSPIDFYIQPSATKDIFLENLIFDAQGSGIKFGQIFSKNLVLTNGVQIQIKSDNEITTFPTLHVTEDFKNKWAALGGDGANFRIDVQAGADEVLAILKFPNPFLLRVQGTFTIDDYIRIRIQDNISSGISRFNFRAKGFEKEP